MTKFAYRGDVTLLHLNARKEGPEEDPVLAVDLKLEATVDASMLASFEPALIEPLFLDSGAVRNIQLGPLAFSSLLRRYQLDAIESYFSGVELKKFVFKPKDGRQLVMTFGASFNPTGSEVATLAEYLGEAITIDLRPADGELDLQESA